MSPENNPLSFEEARHQMASFISAYQPSVSIQRIEIKIHPVDMIAWLDLQKDEVKIYGSNQNDTMSIAGIGQAACLMGKRLSSYKEVFSKLRALLSAQYPYLQWYGGFCFDDRHLDAEWNDFGAYRFILPRFELAAQEGRMIFCCNLIGKEEIKNVLKKLAAIEFKIPFLKAQRKFSVSSRSDDPDQRHWKARVEGILSQKKLKKVVLARKTSLRFEQKPDPWTMLQQLKRVTPKSYHFAFQFKEACFLGASPERLFRRFGRAIESEALAGTIPKSMKAETLLNSVKNKREHALVVEFVDNFFKKYSITYKQSQGPEILPLSNGYHLVTKFQGQLKDGINDEDILQFLHPTPALGGTPQKGALEAIRKLEDFSRGWYGAPIGYVGLDWAEFVVGIRSGLVQGKRLSVFAGAGIVQGSRTKAEWDEVENKISNFIKIIK